MNGMCPCGSQQQLADCCGRYHLGQTPDTPEQLMRSRYSAYVLGHMDYLKQTTLPAQQSGLDLAAMRQWSQNSQWLGLTIEAAPAPQGSQAQVTFRVHWADAQGEQVHHECSRFVHHQERWYFVDPTVPLHFGRNDPCPCQSGLKFKKCCARAL